MDAGKFKDGCRYAGGAGTCHHVSKNMLALCDAPALDVSQH